MCQYFPGLSVPPLPPPRVYSRKHREERGVCSWTCYLGCLAVTSHTTAAAAEGYRRRSPQVVAANHFDPGPTRLYCGCLGVGGATTRSSVVGFSAELVTCFFGHRRFVVVFLSWGLLGHHEC